MSSNPVTSFISPKAKHFTIDPLPSHPQIILVLNLIAGTPPQFHWLLFVPFNSQSASPVESGYEIHATEDYTTGRKVWRFDTRTSTLSLSASTMAAAVIGHMPVLGGKTLNDLVTLLSAIEIGVVPHVDRAREPRFTCRVWMREALRRMHASGYIKCPDVDALEAEMRHYGQEAADALNAERFSKATLRTAIHSSAV